MSIAAGAGVTDEVLAAYDLDGVAVIRDAISPEWIERMQAAVERVIEHPTGHGNSYEDPATGGRFAHDLFLWRHDEDFRAFAFDSPVPAIARAILRTERLNLFFDQLLVKDPGLRMPIAWHQDLMTFPVSGSQVISVWVPFDSADAENGMVLYARGSHRWNRTFQDLNYVESPGDEPVPDPDTFDKLELSVEPGDVVVHHPLTLHGSKGNRSAVRRRRALSIRYAGDDVRFAPKEPNFMSNLGLALPDLALGEPLDHELFPRLD